MTVKLYVEENGDSAQFFWKMTLERRVSRSNIVTYTAIFQVADNSFGWRMRKNREFYMRILIDLVNKAVTSE